MTKVIEFDNCLGCPYSSYGFYISETKNFIDRIYCRKEHKWCKLEDKIISNLE